MNSRVDSLPGMVDLYRKSINSAWKIIVQTRVNKSVEDLNEQSKAEIKLNGELDDIKSKLRTNLHRLEHADRSIPCPSCNRDLDKLTSSEKDSLSKEVDSMKKRKNELTYELERVSGSQSKLSNLIQFKSDLTPDSIEALERNLKNEREKIEELDGLIKKCSEALIEMGEAGL